MPEVTMLVVARAAHAERVRDRVAAQVSRWGIELDRQAEYDLRVLVSNLLAFALLKGTPGQTVSVRLVADRGELTIEVMTGTTASPDRRSEHTSSTVTIPPLFTLHATRAGVEERLLGHRFWATTRIPTARYLPLRTSARRLRNTSLLGWPRRLPSRRRHAA